jgi:hypothetical protein
VLLSLFNQRNRLTDVIVEYVIVLSLINNITGLIVVLKSLRSAL